MAKGMRCGFDQVRPQSLENATKDGMPREWFSRITQAISPPCNSTIAPSQKRW